MRQDFIFSPKSNQSVLVKINREIVSRVKQKTRTSLLLIFIESVDAWKKSRQWDEL